MGSEGFSPFFSFSFRFSSLFFAFLRFFFAFLRFSPILPGQGQTTAIYWENGEFHSDPVCTAKVRALSGKEYGCWKIGRARGNAAGFSPPRPPQPSEEFFWFSCKIIALRRPGWQGSCSRQALHPHAAGLCNIWLDLPLKRLAIVGEVRGKKEQKRGAKKRG